MRSPNSLAKGAWARSIAPGALANNPERMARFWRAADRRCDGNELFYVTGLPPVKMMSADIASSGDVLKAGSPKELFAPVPQPVGLRNAGYNLDITAAGERILWKVAATEALGAQVPITVVLNWPSGLK